MKSLSLSEFYMSLVSSLQQPYTTPGSSVTRDNKCGKQTYPTGTLQHRPQRSNKAPNFLGKKSSRWIKRDKTYRFRRDQPYLQKHRAAQSGERLERESGTHHTKLLLSPSQRPPETWSGQPNAATFQSLGSTGTKLTQFSRYLLAGSLRAKLDPSCWRDIWARAKYVLFSIFGVFWANKCKRF